eukprot:jgi/Picre1/34587/NNA_002055.t1
MKSDTSSSRTKQRTYGVQAKALLRRNMANQRRSPCANLFIILTPICLCVLLDATEENPCLVYDTCKTYDENKCGFEYSNARQASFCPVENPSIWPPVAQVPSEGFLAHPFSPKAAMLMTGDDASIVEDVDLFPVPEVTVQGGAQARAFAEEGRRLDAVFLGTSFLGVTLGTFQKFPNLNYYIEPAFYPTTDYNGTLSLLTSDANDQGHVLQWWR